MCTSVIFGRRTTADGSVILAANDDWEGCPGRLKYQAARETEEGEQFVCVRGKRLPQPRRLRSYLYTVAGYATGTRDDSWIYGSNESGVAVSMSGVYAFRDLGWPSDALEADDLPWLILERGETARGAIEMVGALIAEHGFATSSIEGAEGTAVLAIADPTEGWFLELVPGGEWLATRVPDDSVSVRVNSYGTHEVDLDDVGSVMSSPGLIECAREAGWLVGGQGARFDFTATYGAAPPVCEFGDEADPINVRRRWRLMCLASGDDLSQAEPVYAVRPGHSIGVADVMAMMRDTYEGTECDLSVCAAAGPFHNPFHFEPESYSVAGARTVLSVITQLRSWLPPKVGTVSWVAMDNPATSVYLPWYVGVRHVPDAYGIGTMGTYDEASAWWAFQELSDACYPRYDRAALEVVIPRWRELERGAMAAQGAVERAAVDLMGEDEQSAVWFLDAYCGGLGLSALDEARSLRGRVKSGFADWATVEE